MRPVARDMFPSSAAVEEAVAFSPHRAPILGLRVPFSCGRSVGVEIAHGSNEHHGISELIVPLGKAKNPTGGAVRRWCARSS